jgi:hypothetical protein
MVTSAANSPRAQHRLGVDAASAHRRDIEAGSWPPFDVIAWPASPLSRRLDDPHRSAVGDGHTGDGRRLQSHTGAYLPTASG